MRRKNVTGPERVEIRKLLSRGLSPLAVARQVKRSLSTVYKVRREAAPVDRAAVANWISQNLKDLSHLVELIRDELPRPAPAETPDRVFYTLGRHIAVGDDPGSLYWDTLKEHLRLYTKQDPVWAQIDRYQATVQETRGELEALYEAVHQQVAQALGRMRRRLGAASGADLEESFSHALFYYATTLGRAQATPQSWMEEQADSGQVRLLRYGRIAIATVAEEAKTVVEKLIEELERVVGKLPEVDALRERLAALNRERARIDKALPALLLQRDDQTIVPSAPPRT